MWHYNIIKWKTNYYIIPLLFSSLLQSWLEVFFRTNNLWDWREWGIFILFYSLICYWYSCLVVWRLHCYCPSSCNSKWNIKIYEKIIVRNNRNQQFGNTSIYMHAGINTWNTHAYSYTYNVYIYSGSVRSKVIYHDNSFHFYLASYGFN